MNTNIVTNRFSLAGRVALVTGSGTPRPLMVVRRAATKTPSVFAPRPPAALLMLVSSTLRA